MSRLKALAIAVKCFEINYTGKVFGLGVNPEKPIYSACHLDMEKRKALFCKSKQHNVYNLIAVAFL